MLGLTKEESKSLHDFIEELIADRNRLYSQNGVGANEEAFAWDNTDTLENPKTRALFKLCFAAEEDVPQSLVAQSEAVERVEVELGEFIKIIEDGVPSFYLYDMTAKPEECPSIEELESKGVHLGEKLHNEEWEIDVYWWCGSQNCKRGFYAVTAFNSGHVNRLIKLC